MRRTGSNAAPELTDAQVRRLQRLAGRAEALLADADFKDILVDLKNTAIRDWTAGKDTKAREDAFWLMQAIGRLESIMGAYGGRWRLEEGKHGG